MNTRAESELSAGDDGIERVKVIIAHCTPSCKGTFRAFRDVHFQVTFGSHAVRVAAIYGHKSQRALLRMWCLWWRRWRRRRLANETVENSRKRCWAKAVMRMVTVVMIPMGAALQERCCLCEI